MGLRALRPAARPRPADEDRGGRHRVVLARRARLHDGRVDPLLGHLRARHGQLRGLPVGRGRLAPRHVHRARHRREVPQRPGRDGNRPVHAHGGGHGRTDPPVEPGQPRRPVRDPRRDEQQRQRRRQRRQDRVHEDGRDLVVARGRLHQPGDRGRSDLQDGPPARPERARVRPVRRLGLRRGRRLRLEHDPLRRPDLLHPRRPVRRRDRRGGRRRARRHDLLERDRRQPGRLQPEDLPADRERASGHQHPDPRLRRRHARAAVEVPDGRSHRPPFRSPTSERINRSESPRPSSASAPTRTTPTTT